MHGAVDSEVDERGDTDGRQCPWFATTGSRTTVVRSRHRVRSL